MIGKPPTTFKTFGFPVLFVLTVIAFILASRPELRGSLDVSPAQAAQSSAFGTSDSGEARAITVDRIDAARSPASAGTDPRAPVRIERLGN